MNKDKEYSHVKIFEQKGKKKTLLKHKHPRQTKGNLSFKDANGKTLKLQFSASTQLQSEVDLAKFDDKWRSFRIVSDLWLAIAKNNPKKCFFYVSGNKKSVRIRKTDLNHVPNRILGILKQVKNAKYEY